LAFSGNLRSIVAMLFAVGFFSLMDAAMKSLASVYPPVQVAAMRGLSGLPFVLVYVWWLGAARSLLRVRWPLHLLRGVLSVVMLTLFAFSLRELPLANAYTIFFVAPLLITLLSIPMLNEIVRPSHWIAAAIGLVGVVVALRPDHDAFFTLGALAVLGSAACYSVSAIAGRVLSRTDPSVTLVFWTTVAVAFGAGVLAAPGWVPIDGGHWPLILALAVTGFLGQVCITEAFRHGQAAVVAPFEYTALAWGVGLDWLLWQTFPDAYTWLGGAIIVGSGLYLIRQEHSRRATRIRTAVP
jgi:drug/metabolite transporter (DMT)-like permease